MIWPWSRTNATPTYLFHTNQPIYKVGFSTQITVRCMKYPKHSDLLVLFQVPNGRRMERQVIAELETHFRRRTDIGSEYFEGEYHLMLARISALVIQEVTPTPFIKTSNNKWQCTQCSKVISHQNKNKHSKQACFRNVHGYNTCMHCGKVYENERKRQRHEVSCLSKTLVKKNDDEMRMECADALPDQAPRTDK